MTNCNGYNMVWNPNHHRASTNGMVYEHILEAEKMLGRQLIDEEVVHHKDEIKNNNSWDNLMVFATESDHSRFHITGLCKLDGDHYIGLEKRNICPICGKETSTNKNQYCSHECFNIANRKTEHPSKEELKELIQTYSFLSLGKMFGVSDNAIRKWCKDYNLPYRKKDLK